MYCNFQFFLIYIHVYIYIYTYSYMNQQLITEFEKYIKQIHFDIINTKSKKDKLGHSFRLQATQKVLDIIKNFPSEIKNSAQLSGIKGVGKNSLKNIDEIIEKGKLSKVMDDILDQTYLKYIDELDELYGIGKTKALEYYRTYGVKSIKDLQQLYADGKINLPDNVVIGLKYYGMAKEKIPRSDMIEIDNYLHNVVAKIDIELFCIICGSYRRQKETSNDIDVLIIHPSFKSVNSKPPVNYLNLFVKELKKNKFIVDSLTSDDVPTKYMGLCKWNNVIRRIDIRFIPYNSYYAATLYFTGSADLNKRMRVLADSLGYKLNEYGLYDDKGIQFEVNSEKDIFDLLALEYISPENR